MARWDSEEANQLLGQLLSPSRPISTNELLYGRTEAVEDTLNHLQSGGGTPLIFGNRGVGKTSLAKTVAQLHTASDREPIYVACSPGSRFLPLLRDVAIRLSEMAIRLGVVGKKQFEVEAELGLTPSVRFAVRSQRSDPPIPSDMSEAVRILKDFDILVPKPDRTLIIIDELDALHSESQSDLAYFVKQLGDQDFRLRFILVGIADNIHQLVGAHESAPRYIRNVELGPLRVQELIDIVNNAAQRLGVAIPKEYLFRIAIIGNGYPHFAHLIGLALLQQVVALDTDVITDEVYRSSILRAVRGSIEELKASYDAATQRGTDDYLHLVWTIADQRFVDQRTDQIAAHYAELARRFGWSALTQTRVQTVLGKLRSEQFGQILVHTPKRYGATDPAARRYRHQRFRNSLMRGYVRLRAEAVKVVLGSKEHA